MPDEHDEYFKCLYKKYYIIIDVITNDIICTYENYINLKNL